MPSLELWCSRKPNNTHHFISHLWMNRRQRVKETSLSLRTVGVHFIHGRDYNLVHSVGVVSRAPSTSIFGVSVCLSSILFSRLHIRHFICCCFFLLHHLLVYVYTCRNRWMVNGSPSSLLHRECVCVWVCADSPAPPMSRVLCFVCSHTRNTSDERAHETEWEKNNKEILKIETGKWNTETLNLNSIFHPFKSSQSSHIHIVHSHYHAVCWLTSHVTLIICVLVAFSLPRSLQHLAHAATYTHFRELRLLQIFGKHSTHRESGRDYVLILSLSFIKIKRYATWSARYSKCCSKLSRGSVQFSQLHIVAACEWIMSYGNLFTCKCFIAQCYHFPSNNDFHGKISHSFAGAEKRASKQRLLQWTYS